MRVFTAHDPEAGPDGTDYLIRIHDDNTGDFATRPGRDCRWLTWSPPIAMTVEQLDGLVGHVNDAFSRGGNS